MRVIIFRVNDELACILNLKLIITTLALELLWDLKNTRIFTRALVLKFFLVKILSSFYIENFCVARWNESVKFRWILNIHWGQALKNEQLRSHCFFILKGHTAEGCYYQVRCTWHAIVREACRLYCVLWLKERWLCMYDFMLKVCFILKKWDCYA